MSFSYNLHLLSRHNDLEIFSLSLFNCLNCCKWAYCKNFCKNWKNANECRLSNICPFCKQLNPRMQLLREFHLSKCINMIFIILRCPSVMGLCAPSVLLINIIKNRSVCLPMFPFRLFFQQARVQVIYTTCQCSRDKTFLPLFINGKK